MSEDVIIKGEAGYNRQDPQAGPVFLFAGAILATLFLCFVFVIVYYGWALEVEQYRFQQVPVAQDYKTIEAQTAQQLGQYGYIDRQKGAVRLTVDRAMELFLKESQARKAFYPTAAAPVKVEAPAAAAADPAKPAVDPAKPAEAPKH